jgi:nitrogen fixation NifU-like protein
MLAYSKTVLKLLRDPKNMGDIKKPDGVATVGNRVCGDIMRLYVKVGRKAIGNKRQVEYIENIKFQTLGCPAAVATSSILTEMVKGKSLKEALKVTNKGIVEELGGLPKSKHHCSVLAADALKKAIKNYRGE